MGRLGRGGGTDLGSKLQRLVGGSSGFSFCNGGGIPGRGLVDLDVFIHGLLIIDLRLVARVKQLFLIFIFVGLVVSLNIGASFSVFGNLKRSCLPALDALGIAEPERALPSFLQNVEVYTFIPRQYPGEGFI